MLEPDHLEEEKLDAAAHTHPFSDPPSNTWERMSEHLESPANSSPFEPPFVPVSHTFDDPVNIRQSGLAWSMGIVFFGSVAFMLFLGWLMDLLLGSSPWGIVGGIVLGSIIGFIQFFRISTQMHSNPSGSPEEHPLLPRQDDDNRL